MYTVAHNHVYAFLQHDFTMWLHSYKTISKTSAKQFGELNFHSYIYFLSANFLIKIEEDALIQL